MIRSRIHVASIFLLLLVTVPLGATTDDQQLQLKIGLSKTTFLLNEPIWLDATLTNVSADTVRIFGFWPPAQGDRFGIEIKKRAGEILPPISGSCVLREYLVADFTKEVGHEATDVGCQDEGEDRAGGAAGAVGGGDL
jgi:hypothetical protein